MNMNSMKLRLRVYIKQIQSNKGRFYLTVSGIVLAALMFIIVQVIVNSYINSLYLDARKCSNNAVIITGDIKKDTIKRLKESFPNYSQAEYLVPITADPKTYKMDDFTISLIPIIVGVTNNFTNNAVASNVKENSLFDTYIVEGRDIIVNDIIRKNRVVVISEMTKKILFGKKKAVGQKVEVSFTGLGHHKEIFEIIGVYRDSNDEIEEQKKIDLSIKKGNLECNVLSSFFIPKSIYDEYGYDISENTQTLVMNTGMDEVAKQKVANSFSRSKDVEVSYRERKISEINRINKDFIKYINIIMIVMMIIAGMNLFNSMMFSIRERIYEIGIKKAIGATSIDILNQFIVESLIISTIGAIVVMVAMTFLITIVQYLLDKFSVLSIDIIYSPKMLLEMFCYIIITSIIASVIPAIIAARTTIIDAIKFD